MSAITDTNDNPLTHVSLVMNEGGEQIVTVRVPCVAGMFLTATENAAAVVSARLTGSGDEFTDISASPISLTEFDGEVVEFDVRVQAGDVDGLLRVAIPVRVTFQP